MQKKVGKSTGEGSHHWLWQRKTAIANLILAPWLAVSFVLISQGYYEGLEGWIKLPVNALMLILFFLNTLYHGTLGIKIVIEDYVHNKAKRFFLIVVTELLGVVVFMAALFAILNIYFNFSV